MDTIELSQDHIQFMKVCITLAEKAMDNGDFPVGSIIVKNNMIIGKASEAGKSSNDITQHAEIKAIKNALKNWEPGNLEDCDLYTTHEPCLMCSYVIRHYKIRTVIYGVPVDDLGGITSDLKVMLTTKVPHWGKPPTIIPHVLRKECELLSIHYKELKLK